MVLLVARGGPSHGESSISRARQVAPKAGDDERSAARARCGWKEVTNATRLNIGGNWATWVPQLPRCICNAAPFQRSCLAAVGAVGDVKCDAAAVRTMRRMRCPKNIDQGALRRKGYGLGDS